MKFRKFDRWTPYWFLGGFFFYHFFCIFMPSLASMYLVALGAVLKEVGDEIYAKRNRKEHWFWDKRGGSWDDIIVGVLGMITGVLF